MSHCGIKRYGRSSTRASRADIEEKGGMRVEMSEVEEGIRGGGRRGRDGRGEHGGGEGGEGGDGGRG